MRLLISLLRIDQYLSDVVSVVIAQRPYHDIRLLVDQEGGFFGLGGLLDRGPYLGQVVEIPLHFLETATDARGAHDNAHALGHFKSGQKFLQFIAILALDAARNTASTGILRHGNQESAGQADKAGQRRSLIASFLFLDLDDDFLVYF